MKLLSIDVGIRNLACCVMERNEQNVVSVSWWRVINLIESPVYPCDGKIGKEQRPCSSPAKFTGPGPGGEPQYFCGSHKSAYTVREISVTAEPSAVEGCTSQTCAFEDTACKAKIRKLLDGKGYCNRHGDKVLKKHAKQHVLKVVGQKKCGEADLLDIRTTIWTQLAMHPELLNVDTVVIENQPGLKNPTMKSVAETLFNYFLCRGVIDKVRTGSTINTVKYVSPSNKMKLCPEENADLKTTSNKAQKYRKTKAYSIEKVRSILCRAEDRQAFNANGKKDDLADCLLQGLYVLSTFGLFDVNTTVSCE